MPVVFATGNILEAKQNMILHQVNCKGKMNSGVAKQIREKWNVVYEDYMSLYNSAEKGLGASSLLGTMQIVPIGGNQAVVNLFGQDNFGYNGDRFTDYEAIYKALEQTAFIAKRASLSVALPYKMGCDRGGANWNIVLSMIEELFANHKQKVVIYSYDPNSTPFYLQTNEPPTDSNLFAWV